MSAISPARARAIKLKAAPPVTEWEPITFYCYRIDIGGAKPLLAVCTKRYSVERIAKGNLVITRADGTRIALAEGVVFAVTEIIREVRHEPPLH